MSISLLFLHRFCVLLENFQFPLEHCGVHAGCIQAILKLCHTHLGCVWGAVLTFMYFWGRKQGMTVQVTINNAWLYSKLEQLQTYTCLSLVNICHCCFCTEQRRAGKMPASTGMPAQRPACRTDGCERTRAGLHFIEALCRWKMIFEDKSLVSFMEC